MLDKVKLQIAKLLFKRNRTLTNSEVFSNVYRKNLWRKQISTGETVRKPRRGDNRILNVGLSPKQS